MKWRAEPGAFRCPPYIVMLRGKTWIARKCRTSEMPEHLGSFDDHRKAMEACVEHAEELASEGWGGK